VLLARHAACILDTKLLRHTHTHVHTPDSNMDTRF
jgi:hypothetical protein